MTATLDLVIDDITEPDWATLVQDTLDAPLVTAATDCGQGNCGSCAVPVCFGCVACYDCHTNH